MTPSNVPRPQFSLCCAADKGKISNWPTFPPYWVEKARELTSDHEPAPGEHTHGSFTKRAFYPTSRTPMRFLEEPCLVPRCWVIPETRALETLHPGTKDLDEDLPSPTDRPGDTEIPQRESCLRSNRYAEAEAKSRLNAVLGGNT